MSVVSNTQTLIQSLNQLVGIAFAGVNARAFAAAFELGVFEALGEPLTADVLATRIGIHPIGCRRLLAALASLGLVEGDGETYRNSALGETCSSRASVNLGLLSRIDPFYHMSEFLPVALRQYAPVWEQALGISAMDGFSALYADPVRLRQFADLMDALSVPQGQLIAESFDFAPYRCLMDVAGGPGGQSLSIGRRHPHLRGIVMDMEPMCAIARERIAAGGLDDRFSAVAADLLTGPYPTGADVLLLGHILHDWSDETCRRILRHCAAALPSGGTLVISESVLGDDFTRAHGTNVKDLLMLLANEPGARERTEGEYRALLEDCGFSLRSVMRFEAPRDLIVATRQ